MSHVMIDLETMSTRPNAAITQIGAVAFDPMAGTVDREKAFSCHVDLATAMKFGGLVDASTVLWWLAQDEAARSTLVEGQRNATPFERAMVNFVAWLRERGPVTPWAHGASFDLPIIEVAFGRVNLQAPWKFWDIRDTRTLLDLAGVRKFSDVATRRGPAHSAVDDAVHQAEGVCALYAKLRGAGKQAVLP